MYLSGFNTQSGAALIIIVHKFYFVSYSQHILCQTLFYLPSVISYYLQPIHISLD